MQQSEGTNQFFFLKFDDKDSAFGDKFANAVPLQSRIEFMCLPLYIQNVFVVEMSLVHYLGRARFSHCPDRPIYTFGANLPLMGKPSRRQLSDDQ